MSSRADQLRHLPNFGHPAPTPLPADSREAGDTPRVLIAPAPAGPKALPPTFAELRAEQRRGEVRVYDQEAEYAQH